jgi:hypothetical protein
MKPHDSKTLEEIEIELKSVFKKAREEATAQLIKELTEILNTLQKPIKKVPSSGEYRIIEVIKLFLTEKEKELKK